MHIFALFGVLIGTILADLTVAAIIPAAALVLVMVGVFCIAGGGASGPTALEVGVLVGGLQLGYLTVAGLRA